MTTTMINDLRTRRAETWEKAKAFLTERQSANNGILTAEDDEAYARMEAEIEAFGREIARAERAAELDAQLSKPVASPIAAMPGTVTPEPAGKPVPFRATDEYRENFWNAMRMATNPFEVRNALKEGADTEGGYLVPDEFERTLVEALQEENIIRGLAKRITTTSGDRKIPVVATHGKANWLDEGAAVTESDEAFKQVTLGAYKLSTFIKVSEELLADSAFNIEAYLANEFGRRIGAAEEEAFLVGDGSNKPTGIFHKTGGAEEGLKAAAQAAITADELIDLFYALRSPYRKNAVWLTNDSTVKAIRKLKDNQGQYLWQPALTAGAPDMILGRPIYTSSFVPEIKAGAKTVAFGDLSYYWIADRAGRSFKRLNELFATTGQVGFMATQRVDGKLILPEAVKVLVQKQ
ncbi:phage major capsid protein [Schaalia sp. lx-260]|uniref:phage major capsid protein n=1 Tax=Schaalia sp. lx-260 TaxID=2899082 RepID=UPI001E60FF55|nr:phage major capsid protein [Schaalia sp. lx-260]MCD4549166.1 phage major capsid protein [Schaalia sp. lx-260]